jgi:hypothetical protein
VRLCNSPYRLSPALRAAGLLVEGAQGLLLAAAGADFHGISLSLATSPKPPGDPPAPGPPTPPSIEASSSRKRPAGRRN